MRKDFWRYSGFLLIIIGIVLLFNSFSGITGLAIFEDVKKEASGLAGAVFVIGGIGILMSRAKYGRSYNEIAARVYDVLGTRNAYGHKTEQISVTESKIAAHSPFDKRAVQRVILGEIESGRLLRDKSGQAISISTKPERLEEVIRYCGSKMKDTVVDRLRDLEGGRLPLGVR
jgi:hypothetical protein